MKTINIVLSILFTISTVVFAGDIEVSPSYLKGGIITVKLADGKIYTFSANEYKVVKRETTKPQEQPSGQPSISRPEKKAIRHSLGALVGTSKSRLKVTNSGNVVKSELDYAPVAGAEYRISKDEVFGSVGVLNNKTYIFGIGINF